MRRGRERRHFQRYDVEDVHGRLAVKTELDILNMSLTGIAVRSPVAVAPGERRTILLTDKNGRKVEILGEAQRCEMRSVDPPLYEVGFDFTSDLGGKAPSILEFLEAHIVVDLDRRISGRFAIRDDASDRAEMRAHVDFEVRRLSRSGMLVETDLLIFADEDNVYDLVLDAEDLHLEAKGRVAMVDRPDASSDERLRMGVEFVDLDERQRARLLGYIRRLID